MPNDNVPHLATVRSPRRALTPLAAACALWALTAWGAGPAATTPNAQTPASVPAETTAAGNANPSAPAGTAEETFRTRVKSLEERISDLKEKILLSKTRLQALQEKVLGGDLSGGARVVLLHKKELSSAYELVSISYILDGAPVKTRVDDNGDLNQLTEFEIFNGPIVPGNHQLSVKMVLRGGTRGVFSYAADYTFTTSASFTFNAEPTKLTTVNAVAFEKGGFTAKLQDRPGFRFETQVTQDGAVRPSVAGETAAGSSERKP